LLYCCIVKEDKGEQFTKLRKIFIRLGHNSRNLCKFAEIRVLEEDRSRFILHIFTYLNQRRKY